MAIVTDTEATNGNLSAVLPSLLPLVAGWAEKESHNILTLGKPLAFWQLAEAKQVGVRDPEKVRVLRVDTMPEPANSQLLAATLSAGLLGPETLGLTLGAGILILRSRIGERQILRHELRHVAQYEAAGSIRAFLAEYLDQIASFGYWEAPLEMDARCHERGQPPASRATSIGKTGSRRGRVIPWIPAR